MKCLGSAWIASYSWRVSSTVSVHSSRPHSQRNWIGSDSGTAVETSSMRSFTSRKSLSFRSCRSETIRVTPTLLLRTTRKAPIGSLGLCGLASNDPTRSLELIASALLTKGTQTKECPFAPAIIWVR